MVFGNVWIQKEIWKNLKKIFKLKKKTKILVVGGTGFIGYHLIKQCIKKNWKVTSISAHKPKPYRHVKKVKYLVCDISKKKQLIKIIKGNYDYLVNLGGYVDHSNKLKTYESHYIGVKNLSEIFLNRSLKSFVQIGSGGEYGNSSPPHKESSITNINKINSVYFKSKLLSSMHLINLYIKFNFPITILRLYQAYGLKQDVNRLIPIVITNCIKGKKFNCSEGKQFRDFIFIDDVVKAIILSLKRSSAKGEIFNIASGKIIKVKKLIQIINSKVGAGQPQYGKIKLRKDEKLFFYPSIKKAKKILNWHPSISIDQGLNETIKSYKKYHKIK